MRSPFAIFRKHQKLLTVILTGLAMFAFVILGAVQDPSSMPPGLIVLVVACIVGAVAWLMGLQSGKSSEYGVVGLILGAILGVGFNLAGGPPDVVLADSGNIDAREMNELQYRRSVANGFLQEAYFAASGEQQGFVPRPQPFGFGSPDAGRDVVLGELLRREADRLGVAVTDSTVNEYIKSVFGEQIRAPEIREIRNRLRVSETDLYGVLKDELRARITAQYLYGGIPLPPESYWEFYRQMRVKQDAAIVPIDVKAFVDEQVVPDEGELLSLFTKYQKTFPNTNEDGQAEEGRPGFRQPRRVKLAFVEAVYTDIESRIDPITDADIEKYYEENYRPTPSDAPAAEANENGPMLPDLTPETAPAEQPMPAAEATPIKEPAGQADPGPSGSEESVPPTESEKPANPDKPEVEGDSSVRPTRPLEQEGQLQMVAIFDDAEPATQTTPVEAPAAKDGVDAEQTQTGAAPKDSDAGRPPAPPEATKEGGAPLALDSQTPVIIPGPRPLDDDLRSEIRDMLLRERTELRMQEVIDEVDEYMTQTLAPGNVRARGQLHAPHARTGDSETQAVRGGARSPLRGDSLDVRDGTAEI